MKLTKATKTTKVFDSTLDTLRILTKHSAEGLTQAQIIARAVYQYATDNGYINTISGIVGVGDKVLVGDTELVIKLITENNIIFTDFSEISKGSGIAWRMKRITND